MEAHPDPRPASAPAAPGAPAGPSDGTPVDQPWARSGEEALEALAASGTEGLSQTQAAERLAAHGRNELTAAPPTPWWARVLRLLNEPLTYLLLAAIGVSLVTWAIEGRQGLPVDAIVVGAVIVLNTVIGLVQELKAADAVAALRTMASPTAVVTRDGAQRSIPVAELVPGDLLHLDEGDAIPADARILRAGRLMVAEAALTGESVPVEKSAPPVAADADLAERTSMVHAGTAVTQGSAVALVTGTGADTEIGRIAGMIAAAPETVTPLQREMAAVGRMLTVAVVAIALVTMVTAYLVTDDHSLESVVTILLLGVSLAVAAVPEGLTAIVSVVLALGVRRMATRNAIVKQLDAVEVLGSAGVVATDKTGTLTLNEMTVEAVLTGNGRVEPADPRAAEVLALGSLASNARLTADGAIGDPTELAFLTACRDEGVEVPAWRRLDELPFSSERKRMSVLFAPPEAPTRLVTKGAPDVVLGLCERVRTAEGDVELTAQARERLEAGIETLAGQAYRTLAVAEKEVPAATPAQAEERTAPAGGIAESDERGLTLVGIAAMIDPPRPEAAQAIAQAQHAGIRVMMITGDHPVTAQRIASDLGIEHAHALTGRELRAMDDAQLAEAIERSSVFARVDPSHKLRIVEALQHSGKAVAMTGDGVNDAPALKRADIGVAMGITGTQVSRDAATMILADDNFATIIAAVKQGRGIFANLTKVLRYLLSSNMGEVFTVFGGVVLAGLLGLVGPDGAMLLPLLATQILWVNLVTDSMPALALGVEPVEDEVMDAPPRDMSKRALDRGEWLRILGTGLVMGVLALGSLDWCLPGGLFDGGDDITTSRTVAFTVLVFLQLANTLSVRHARRSMFSHLFANGWLWSAIGLTVALQALVVYVPVLNTAFSTAPLDDAHWGIVGACVMLFIACEELRKAIARGLRRRRQALSPETK